MNNSVDPLQPNLKISLTECFRIQEDWCDEGSIYVDEEENILYWVSRENVVYKINNNGNILFKKTFKTGQGYGDINFIDFSEWNGSYYVYDKSNFRLHIFDKQLNLETSHQFNRRNVSISRNVLRMDEAGNQYYIFENNSFRNGIIYSDIAVSNFGRKGEKKIADYYKQGSKLFDKNGNRMLMYFYLQPFLRYLIGDHGEIWLCNNREYRIYKYFPDGNLDKVIEKKYEKIEIKGEMEKHFREEYQIEKLERSNTEVILPEYLNPLIGILLIDKNYMFVLRGDYIFNKEKPDKILVDIFNLKGVFLNQTELPKFYGCYYMSNQFKPNIYYRNGHLYTLETDKDYKEFRIVKYNMSIE